ncbi:MFS transporter [Marinobacter sp.]|uniref:MFS transporter n=1 Tax=Marinobacter sp. TaxID=50741 RepID=UPI0034A48D6C
MTSWLTAALTLGCFSVVMSATTINVAITPMMKDLDLGPQVAQLFSSVFLGLTVVVAPISAWVADRFGPWRVFLGVLVVYVIASLLGLFLEGFTLLLLVRVFQGMCAGIAQPLSMFLLLECTPAARHGRALSMFGLGVVMAPAMGPAIAGWVVDHAGWQFVFALGVVPALIAALMVQVSAKPAQTPAESRKITDFDWRGLRALAVLVVAVFLWPFSWAVSPWAGIVHSLVWVVGLTLFWSTQKSRPDALIPTDLFLQPAFRRAALITMAYGTGMYGSIFLIPLLLQDGLGVSAAMTGNFLLIGGIFLAASIVISGRLVDVFSPRHILVLGMMSFTLSCVLFTLSENLVVLAVAIALSRVGLGSIIPSLYSAMARSVGPEELRQATSMTTFLRQGGGALGIVVLGLGVSWISVGFDVSPDNHEDIYGWLFAVLAVLFGSAAVMARKLG